MSNIVARLAMELGGVLLANCALLEGITRGGRRARHDCASGCRSVACELDYVGKGAKTYKFKVICQEVTSCTCADFVHLRHCGQRQTSTGRHEVVVSGHGASGACNHTRDMTIVSNHRMTGCLHALQHSTGLDWTALVSERSTDQEAPQALAYY